ncbi:aminopeptidase P family protein [Alphaproteobacteria bacterium]|nr:aminopeptidase P family protein [Alphaproteobacteria bacterium]
MHKLKTLRELIKRMGIDGMIIPMSDPFQNDFIPEYYHRIKYLSGFTGSLGTIIVLKDSASIFIDGRYTLQAQKEVCSKSFEINDYGTDSMIEWILKKSKRKIKLGYDPWDYTVTQIESLERKEDSIIFSPLEKNPIDELWETQPPILKTKIFLYPEKYAGLSWKEKTKLLEKEIKKKQLDAIFLTSSASICWLLNIRGKDVPYTPISLCYALVHKTGKIDLFTYLENLTPEIRKYFSEKVFFHKMSGTDLMKTLPSLVQKLKIGYTESQSPIQIKKIIEPSSSSLKNIEDPCVLLRSLKTKTEISHSKQAHIWDGVALVKFFYWLEKTVPIEKITEFDAAQKIDFFRAESKHFKGLSFPTISGANQNGSIVHYRAGKTSLTLKEGDIFLCDSGGHYFEGTTDVTRTVCFGGNPTKKQKDIFTRVLKGFIALSMVRFPVGTTGSQLDILARQSLWEIGLDYAHATGHGVGQYSNVHEGPHNISRRPSKIPLKPGMIVSNEPGCYLKGEFGIRTENLIFVKETNQRDSLGQKLLEFETLTLCPIDYTCIDTSLLTKKEIDWLNTYHQKVWENLNKLLDPDQKKWLKKETRPLDQEASHQDSIRDSITGSISG